MLIHSADDSARETQTRGTRSEMTSETPYLQARQAYVAGNFDKCLTILREQVEGNDANCMVFLGTFYHEGEGGVEKDIGRAIMLYEQSAKQTNHLGTYMLGRTHYLGLGIPKNKEKGLRLLKRAAFMGFTEAQMLLAQHYQKGFFKRKLYVSVAWLLVAEHFGDSNADKIAKRSGPPPSNSIALAERIVDAIQALQLLSGVDPEVALERLDEIEVQEWE